MKTLIRLTSLLAIFSLSVLINSCGGGSSSSGTGGSNDRLLFCKARVVASLMIFVWTGMILRPVRPGGHLLLDQNYRKYVVGPLTVISSWSPLTNAHHRG